MYRPRHFTEDRLDVLTACIAAHPFATLVSLGDDGLIATHLPLLWDAEPEPFGTLRGHFARPNPHGRLPERGVDALAIFHGPNAYVSPSWYPSKAEHGKVVPTWNYVAVHAYGPLRVIDDHAWLRAFVTRLTDLQERRFPSPWRVSDAPDDYLHQMTNGIVGVEITVRRFEGKWKLGQNRSPADFAGAIDGLRATGDPASTAVAEVMALTQPEPPRPGRPSTPAPPDPTRRTPRG